MRILFMEQSQMYFLSEIQKKLQLSGDALAIAEGEPELDWKTR
jgi:hypothetical protein